MSPKAGQASAVAPVAVWLFVALAGFIAVVVTTREPPVGSPHYFMFAPLVSALAAAAVSAFVLARWTLSRTSVSLSARAVVVGAFAVSVALVVRALQIG